MQPATLKPIEEPANTEATQSPKLLLIKRLSIVLIFYALIIILWGAFVRISGSGDGCGAHWPLCHGTIFINPDITNQAKVWIEFAHRLKSGIFGILVLALTFLVWRYARNQRPLLYSAILALILTIVESLFGAWLVLRGLVADNTSSERILTASLHLVNTQFLMAALTLCYIHAKSVQPRMLFIAQEIRKPALVCLIIIIFMGLTGAWAALGNTLAPSANFAAGISADFSSNSPLAVKLRIIHPLLGVILSAILIYCSYLINSKVQNKFSKLCLTLALVQPLIGLITLLTLSPVSLKLAHLLLANLLWISLVLTVFSKGKTSNC